MRVRLRKEVYLVLAVLVIIALFVIFRPKGHKKLDSTNLDGVDIYTGIDDPYIQFGENDKIALGTPVRMFLISNGNIVKSSNISVLEGQSQVPLEVFQSCVGAELKISPSNGDEFTLSKKDIKVTFRLNDTSAEVNGKPEFLAASPTREGKIVYIPLKQFFEFFGYNVSYTNGLEPYSDVTPLIPEYQQIFVSKYPEKAKLITKEEAVDKLIKTLKSSYKKTFGKKWSEPKEGDKFDNSLQEEAAKMLGGTYSVSGENDRYYVIPYVWDWYVDKYTGDIYLFYKGQTYQYRKFGPKDNYPAFAG